MNFAVSLDSLPIRRLADLEGGARVVVLCPSARLADDLRHAHGRAQVARGAAVWAALASATPAQWLDHLVSAALLRGEVPAAALPGSLLTSAQERCLWRQAIAADQALGGVGLFDEEGLARAAMAADGLSRAWPLRFDEAEPGEELRAWMRWRAVVTERCASARWLGAEAALEWRLACLERGIGGLPEALGVAGFVRLEPRWRRLLDCLAARGVALFALDCAHAESGAPASVFQALDAEAECQAAAAWAKRQLAARPQARLRIAMADWPARRAQLEAALESALHPSAVGAGWAACERRYAAEEGAPLAEQPLVATAMALLGLLVRPRRVSLGDFGALLCAPGWSADIAEADARARLEADLRERLPPETSVAALRRVLNWRAGRLAARQAGEAAPPLAPRLLAALEALAQCIETLPRRLLPGEWAPRFAALLEALGWPGERALLAAEAEACAAWRESLAGLGRFDAVVGRLDGAGAWGLLASQLRERRWRPSRQAPPAVAIGSLDLALGGPLDGLWVMGLSEGAWPPPELPNPLLPALAQRRAGVPVACGAILAADARAVQALWCAAARETVLSCAAREGERALRPSPLLAGLEALARLAEEAAPEAPAAELQRLSDQRAPALAEGASVAGGTWLLRAQAICPAWGFFEFRLGGAALPAPSFGLDAKARGTLLHDALEAFWQGRAWADLQALDAQACRAAIAVAVASALARFDQRALEPLPPRLRALEAERLGEVIEAWLALERQRQPFTVQACEEEHRLLIEGLPVRVVIDRIDRLADGGLLIIDYKSGRSAAAERWAAPRLAEPQLPLYAALALPDSPVVAVAVARVMGAADGVLRFEGVAAVGGLLPGVKALEEQRRRYDEAVFPDWSALRRVWAARIGEIAREVRAGVAAVVFEKEDDLAVCQVAPLLRLAERRRQWESAAREPTP